MFSYLYQIHLSCLLILSLLSCTVGPPTVGGPMYPGGTSGDEVPHSWKWRHVLGGPGDQTTPTSKAQRAPEVSSLHTRHTLPPPHHPPHALHIPTRHHLVRRESSNSWTSPMGCCPNHLVKRRLELGRPCIIWTQALSREPLRTQTFQRIIQLQNIQQITRASTWIGEMKKLLRLKLMQRESDTKLVVCNFLVSVVFMP